jgi:hypothetical protein
MRKILRFAIQCRRRECRQKYLGQGPGLAVKVDLEWETPKRPIPMALQAQGKVVEVANPTSCRSRNY